MAAAAAEAEEAETEEAWEEESNGMGHLRHSQFNDSLFELVDMWTTTTETAEYVDVLRRLHGCCFDGAGSFFSDAAAKKHRDHGLGCHRASFHPEVRLSLW